MVNYTSSLVPYTRKIEHKHFEFSKSDQTVITTEYPQEWDKSCERFYPVNDLENNKKYEKYRKLALKDKNIIFGGRLAEYKYYDMHQVIGSALNKANEI
jgi:UDP-galactopyranose mutase